MEIKELEEAAENESEYLADWEDKSIYVRGFVDGAKWQAERMYSEEDLRQAYIVGKHGGVNQTYYDFDEWFEQFKKK